MAGPNIVPGLGNYNNVNALADQFNAALVVSVDQVLQLITAASTLEAKADLIQLHANTLLLNKPYFQNYLLENVDQLTQDDGLNVLHVCAGKGYPQATSVLLSCGFNIDWVLVSNESALHFAVRSTSMDTLNIILNNMSANILSQQAQTAMQLAHSLSIETQDSQPYLSQHFLIMNNVIQAAITPCNDYII